MTGHLVRRMCRDGKEISQKDSGTFNKKRDTKSAVINQVFFFFFFGYFKTSGIRCLNALGIIPERTEQKSVFVSGLAVGIVAARAPYVQFFKL